MSNIVREQQQGTHQSFAFLDVRVMITKSIGIGVTTWMVLGIMKALTVKQLTLTLLSVSHVAKQVFPNLN